MKRSTAVVAVLTLLVSASSFGSITAQIRTGSAQTIPATVPEVHVLSGKGLNMLGGYFNAAFVVDAMATGMSVPNPGTTLPVVAADKVTWPGDLGTTVSCTTSGSGVLVTVSKSGTWPLAVSGDIESWDSCYNSSGSVCDPTDPMSSLHANTVLGSSISINPSSGNDHDTVYYAANMLVSPDNGSHYVNNYGAVGSVAVFCPAGGPCQCP